MGTPSYQIAKFLVPIMNSITSGKFTVKDTFCFAKEIIEQDSSLVMSSLDVDILFTNIPLDETTDICTNTIYSQQDVIEDINKQEFQNLLSLATKESYFIFSEVLYKQKDGVAMSFPLGPTLGNAFLCFYEKNDLKTSFCRRYVDDVFVLFKSTDHIEKFRNYFNTCHEKMYFSFEKEKTVKCPF